MKIGSKVICSLLSNEVGKIVDYNKSTRVVSIKYKGSRCWYDVNASDCKIVN